MTLVQAWVDSVSLLKPKNLHLFVLVTVKSIGDAYRVVLCSWWLLYLVIGACYFFAEKLIPYEQAEFLSRWSYQALLFATIAATRPSLMPKDSDYFKTQMRSFFIVIPFLLIFPVELWPSALSPMYLFTILFYLDSSRRMIFMKWIKSIKESDSLMAFFNAIKMIIYNYPLLFIMGLFFYTPLYCVYCYFYFFPLLHNLIAALLLPIAVCTYTNIYIKKLHDHFDLYFKQPK